MLRLPCGSGVCPTFGQQAANMDVPGKARLEDTDFHALVTVAGSHGRRQVLGRKSIRIRVKGIESQDRIDVAGLGHVSTGQADHEGTRERGPPSHSDLVEPTVGRGAVNPQVELAATSLRVVAGNIEGAAR